MPPACCSSLDCSTLACCLAPANYEFVSGVEPYSTNATLESYDGILIFQLTENCRNMLVIWKKAHLLIRLVTAVAPNVCNVF